jgi:hypothetical protein
VDFPGRAAAGANAKHSIRVDSECLQVQDRTIQTSGRQLYMEITLHFSRSSRKRFRNRKKVRGDCSCSNSSRNDDQKNGGGQSTLPSVFSLHSDFSDVHDVTTCGAFFPGPSDSRAAGGGRGARPVMGGAQPATRKEEQATQTSAPNLR